MKYRFSEKNNGSKLYNVIYKITNDITGKEYIGKTAYLPNRISLHKSRYKNTNYKSELYSDMRKYGLENFILEVIEVCEENLLNEKETYYIEKYNTVYNGYNKSKTQGGLASELYTKEQKEKFRENSLGIKNNFYGKTHSLEVRKKINRNRTISQETKEKMSKNSKGKDNAKGKNCVLILNKNITIEFKSLSKCYKYLIENELFPKDYSFNSFVRWYRNDKLKEKKLNFEILEEVK